MVIYKTTRDVAEVLGGEKKKDPSEDSQFLLFSA